MNPLLLVLSLFLLSVKVESTSFKIVNRCRHTIWPGILTGADRTVLTPTGFTLKSGKSKTLKVPNSWSGRVWARTHCSVGKDGRFVCATADCGSGKVQCSEAGAIPPATLAEFTLNGDQGLDFYDVSLVDGYNLPVLIVPMRGVKGACASTGCLVDLNGACPSELKVMSSMHGNSSSDGVGVACKSACEAFGSPQFCSSDALLQTLVNLRSTRCTSSMLAHGHTAMPMMIRRVHSHVQVLITLSFSALNLTPAYSM